MSVEYPRGLRSPQSITIVGYVSLPISEGKRQISYEQEKKRVVPYKAAFFMHMLLGMVLFSTPLFAIRLGAGPFVLGQLGFTFALFHVIFSPVFGKLSDYMRCKYLILLGSLFYFVSSLILSYATQIYQLFISMVLIGGLLRE